MATLRQLAEKAGISSAYTDKTGTIRNTADNVRSFFLKSMGIKASTPREIDESYEELSKEPLLPDVLSFFDNEDVVIAPQSDTPVALTLINEDKKEVWKGEASKLSPAVIKNLPAGYYDLIAGNIKSLLILAPEMCYLPPFIKNKEHLYGVSAMLYALRSKGIMGIGDFSSLKELVRQTAQKGGDAVGINPLGIMSPALLPSPFAFPFKGDVSPYRALSRLFVSYAYLDLKAEPDFASAAKAFVNTTEVEAEIARLNASPDVLYAEVLSLKRRILELMYDTFIRTAEAERKAQFLAWKEAKNPELENLCLFEVLIETHKESPFWRFWNDGASDINSPQNKTLRETKKARIDFYAYCHWLAACQLKAVQDYAKSLGMKIGLYADMPIGAASNGAEVWENPKAYVLDAGVGAPADPMRPRGQSWGFTPYHPRELEKEHYAPFIRLARENMQNAGALRIDHAMGLRRLFWGFFAENDPVVRGAYVYYDIKALTAILSLESNRASTLLIGEDLGTVPEGFREYMAAHGLLSYKVFFRQKEKDGTFIAPSDYMYMSLAQSSTHDQATTLGFWTNEDIEVFNRCALYVNNEQYQKNLDGRKQDRINLIAALDAQGLLPSELKEELEKTKETGQAAPAALNAAVNAYGAKTRSALYFVRLCDICGQQKLDNAPGTIDEYPNWRLKLKTALEELENADSFIKALAEIRRLRPKS